MSSLPAVITNYAIHLVTMYIHWNHLLHHCIAYDKDHYLLDVQQNVLHVYSNFKYVCLHSIEHQPK